MRARGHTAPIAIAAANAVVRVSGRQARVFGPPRPRHVVNGPRSDKGRTRPIRRLTMVDEQPGQRDREEQETRAGRRGSRARDCRHGVRPSAAMQTPRRQAGADRHEEPARLAEIRDLVERVDHPAAAACRAHDRRARRASQHRPRRNHRDSVPSTSRARRRQQARRRGSRRAAPAARSRRQDGRRHGAAMPGAVRPWRAGSRIMAPSERIDRDRDRPSAVDVEVPRAAPRRL